MSITDDKSFLVSSPSITTENPLAAVHECRHEGSTLRNARRTFRNGQVVYCKQCLRCGSVVGKMVGEFKCQDVHGFDPTNTELFDENLSSRIWKETYENLETLRHENDRRKQEEWQEKYREYLRSERWHLIREKVLQRERYLCQGCGDARANEVHHSTYVHVGDEFLFELVALCSACHRRFHGR